MRHVKPIRMMEFGVASGFSSAFIVQMAEQFGLLGTVPGPFLTSFDLMNTTAEGNVVGSLFAKHYPEQLRHWRLNVEKTSLDLLLDDSLNPLNGAPAGPVLTFVDGGHAHPWPVMDLVALRKRLPFGSWILLQDSQMMERWLADCVEYGVACPAPVRGVNLAVMHYPGTKLIGTGICYNCAAIRLDVDDREFERFVDACLTYNPEIPFDHWDALRAASRAVS